MQQLDEILKQRKISPLIFDSVIAPFMQYLPRHIMTEIIELEDKAKEKAGQEIIFQLDRLEGDWLTANIELVFALGMAYQRDPLGMTALAEKLNDREEERQAKIQKARSACNTTGNP